MICLIEGPDGAGKTTLAEALASWATSDGYEALISHTGAPEPPGLCPFTEYESSLDRPGRAELVRSQRHLVIFDRYHTGEGLYGPVFRGASRLSLNGFYHCELALDALGAVKIAVLPALDELHGRLAGRTEKRSGYDEQFLSLASLTTARTWYDGYAQLHRYHVWDGRRPSQADLSRLLLDLGRKAENADAVGRLSAGTYIGSLTPRVLLCGDVRGNGKLGRPDLIRPFTPATASGCSGYLLHALQLTSLSHGLGIVNVNEPELPVNVRGLWRVLGEPPAVALGERASRRLRELSLPHRKLAHPQWANRFRHRDQPWYAAEIEKAAAPQ